MTDQEQTTEDPPAIPGQPLEPPVTVPEALGAAIRMAGEGSAGLSEVRSAPPWAAPEVLDGRSFGTAASDAYSLGAVLWHLLAGRPPFWASGGDNSPRALTARILHAAPPPTGRDDLPAGLERLLADSLSKTPEKRPESPLALARALQAIEAEAGYPPTPLGAADGDAYDVPVDTASGSPPREAAPSAPTVPDARPSVWRTPALWWSVAGVVIVALAAVGITMLARAPDTARPPSVGGATRTTAPPGTVPQPILTARRLGTTVEFRWRAADVPQAGDSYEWRVAGQGGTHLTTGPAVTIPSAARVCLQVRMTRDGLPPSPYARGCA